MKQINVLSQETIDKIAAGEVVERPASVVKELVENSIDAGSTAITIEIKGGGIEYIRISDNGSGIDNTMIQTAFLRHATSKIQNVTDLDTVQSLGFRGEALSSISAVAKVQVITKTEDALFGSQYIIEGAKEISLNEIAAPDGTTFIVRQLFYNTPARKKFLKSESTESSYIFDIVEHLALSHPEISFRFLTNGKEKLMTTGNGKLSDTIYQIYGRQIASNILDISFENDLVKISGYIGKSVLARGNRAFENFYINHRYVKSNHLSKAVEEGYYGFLMGHQYPLFLINMEFPDGSVDVNVHPTKQEVRFSSEPEICQLLTKVVQDRLTQREDILEAEIEEKKTIPPIFIENQTSDIENIVAKPITKTAEPFEKKRLDAIKETIVSQIKEDSPYEKKYQHPDKTTYQIAEQPQQLAFLDMEAVKEHKIIGQVFNTYWLIEYNDKLYIIDQHAAHEKVLFEKNMKRIKENHMTSQMICPPIIISLSPTDLLIYNEYKSAFEKIGFDIEEFGGNEVAIKGIPDNFLGLDAQALFLEILADCTNFKSSDSFESVIEKVASMSCKAAVKGNNKLSNEEIKELISQLLKCDNPYHCPHGRPTMISFSEYELAKKFKRII